MISIINNVLCDITEAAKLQTLHYKMSDIIRTESTEVCMECMSSSSRIILEHTLEPDYGPMRYHLSFYTCSYCTQCDMSNDTLIKRIKSILFTDIAYKKYLSLIDRPVYPCVITYRLKDVDDNIINNSLKPKDIANI